MHRVNKTSEMNLYRWFYSPVLSIVFTKPLHALCIYTNRLIKTAFNQKIDLFYIYGDGLLSVSIHNNYTIYNNY